MTSFILIPLGGIAYTSLWVREFRDSPFFSWFCLSARARIAWTTQSKERHKFQSAHRAHDTVADTPNDRPTDRVQVFHAMHLNLLFCAINHAHDSEYVSPFIRAFVLFFGGFSCISWLRSAESEPKLRSIFNAWMKCESNANNANVWCERRMQHKHDRTTTRTVEYLSLIDEWNGEKWKETTEINLNSLTRHDLFIVDVFCPGIVFAHFFCFHVFVESKQQVFWLYFTCWIFVSASQYERKEGEINTGIQWMTLLVAVVLLCEPRTLWSKFSILGSWDLNRSVFNSMSYTILQPKCEKLNRFYFFWHPMDFCSVANWFNCVQYRLRTSLRVLEEWAVSLLCQVTARCTLLALSFPVVECRLQNCSSLFLIMLGTWLTNLPFMLPIIHELIMNEFWRLDCLWLIALRPCCRNLLRMNIRI